MDAPTPTWMRQWYEGEKTFLKVTVPQFIRSNVNWRFVRGLGELQILTRASYFMIVFVPIIASMWPGVRLLINDYNQTVKSTQELAESVYKKVETAKYDAQEIIGTLGKRNSQDESTFKNASSKVDAITRMIEQDVREIRLAYAPWYMNSQNLPWTWGALFFAAVFVVIGHLVYQTRASEVVRRYTLDDYVRAQRADHLSQESPIALSEAMEAIRSPFGITQYSQRLTQADSDVIAWVEQGSHLPDLPLDRLLDAIESIELHLQHLRRIPLFEEDSEGDRKLRNQLQHFRRFKNRFENVDQKEKVAIIEKGARINYLKHARKNPTALVVTLFLYLVGLCFIVRVITVQSELVIQMTNWKSISEALNFQ